MSTVDSSPDVSRQNLLQVGFKQFHSNRGWGKINFSACTIDVSEGMPSPVDMERIMFLKFLRIFQKSQKQKGWISKPTTLAMHIYIYICMYIYLIFYIIYVRGVCVYICIYVYTYIYINIRIHTHTIHTH